MPSLPTSGAFGIQRSSRRTLLGSIALGWLGSAAAVTPDHEDPDEMYAALQSAAKVRQAIGGGEIDIVFAANVPVAQQSAILTWIQRGATAVTAYFGRFPVTHVGILVTSGAGGRVGHGTTYGYAGPAIRIDVGRDADAATFDADWVLVHEMVHLSFPTVPRRHLWIEEGSAVYVEPIARVQAGQLTDAQVWHDMRRSMGQGLPQPGDQGLDRTHSWGRTYWGGAMFCLLADVDFRRRTGNRVGLQDALRAINRASRGNEARWPVAKAFDIGDAACGVGVLSALYDEHKDAAVTPKLDALFDELGVREDGTLDDSAPLAAVRGAIMARRAR